MNKQVINALLVVLAIVVVLFLFNSFRKSSIDSTMVRDDTIVDTQKMFEHTNESPMPVDAMDGHESVNQPVVSYNLETKSVGCPIEQTENELREYYNRLYGTRQMSDRQRAKMALCEQTNFKGMVNGSSDNMGTDTVDRVAMLYLSGNGTEARRHQGKSIRKVFDSLTSDENLTIRHNIRLPDFEEMDCSKQNLV